MRLNIRHLKRMLGYRSYPLGSGDLEQRNHHALHSWIRRIAEGFSVNLFLGSLFLSRDQSGISSAAVLGKEPG